LGESKPPSGRASAADRMDSFKVLMGSLQMSEVYVNI